VEGGPLEHQREGAAGEAAAEQLQGVDANQGLVLAVPCVEVGRQLPYSIFDKNPIVTQGAVVENKRLGAVLTAIQTSQTKRDQARLASRKLSLREKERIRAARVRAGTPGAEACPTTPNRTSLLGRKADISTWV